MAHDNVIYQGDFYKLSEARKLFIGSKTDSWKAKYIIVHTKENAAVLELHKKKPKATKKPDKTLTDSFELPAFKVEKLKNARGRSFVCEITAQNVHLFLSADEEKQIDILIFLLQTQLRLKDEIRDDIIRVVPENSESQKKIGAKGSHCLLHISPWGLTLVLERSRCLLAQWPLKSIRYYEASGAGLFTIEAGRVAPMGEGVFGFQTLPGDDDIAYDRVDNYIVNTLDRVKPNQRGTKEEIEDYIREHDHLHALTVVSIASILQREIQKALKVCWDAGRSTETFADAVLEPRDASSAESSVRNSASSTHTSSLNVTLERVSITDVAGSRSDYNSSDSRRSSVQTEHKSPGSRPPLPSAKSRSGSGVPRRSRRREHSLPRKVDVAEIDTYGSSPRLAHRNRPPDGVSVSPELPPRPLPATLPRRHSNPSNVVHQVSNTDATVNLHPYVNQPHKTEFYNLHSPNLKVRKNKSPMVTRNRNKVGRAELLLSVDQSGVRSPTTSTSTPPTADSQGFGRWDLSAANVTYDEHREEQDYLDAIARASQQKYGHNSIDRAWVKMRRDLSGGDLPDDLLSPGYVNTFPPTGYINIQKLVSMEEEHRVAHKRQNSLEVSSPSMSRQSSKASLGDAALSPPIIHHSRQRSAPVEGSVSSMGSVTAASNQSYLTMPDHSEGLGNDSGISMRSKQNHQNSEGVVSESSSRHASQLSGFSAFDQVDSPVAEWLISASCEDLSDHMRNVIYDDKEGDDNNNEKVTTNKDDSRNRDEEDENAYEEIQSDKDDKSDNSSSTASASNDKPPLPFTGLKKFQNKVDIGSQRDRSKSFGYMNAMQTSPSSGAKPQSSAPSAHLIRKMVAARSKQDSTLRKSLSNPNFLNLGSKEHLFNLKTVSTSGMGHSNSNLQANTKQKSRSFSSLFPALKKALSRESLGHSRSTTPERRSSFTLRRRPSEHEFRRRSSVHSVGEMTIKGIRMTERSRSFRRVRGAKSVEMLSKSENEEDNRLSTMTNISSPPTLSSQNSEVGSSPSKLANSNSKATPPSGRTSRNIESPSEKRSANSNRSSSASSPQVTPSTPRLSSNIQVTLSDSMESMSPAPSPSHLPPPPIPARKPCVVSESSRNGSSIVSTSSSISKSVPSKQNHHNSASRSSSSSNYMNTAAVSIKKPDVPSRVKQESTTASLSINRRTSKSRISDKGDVKPMEFGGKPTKVRDGQSVVKRVVSAGETQISAPSSKNKMPAKAKSSKINTKS